MKNHSGLTTSIWMRTAEVPVQSKLVEDITADVCIVGAGITGMTTALMLQREGQRVVVLDDGPIGAGETERTTAHLVNALDDRYYQIERIHGENGARLAAESHTAAISCVETLVREEDIDCEFERVNGYLFSPPGEPTEALDRELAAAHRAGLSDVKRLWHAPLNFFDTGPCLRFPRQAQFHPLKYLRGLAEIMVKERAKIFSQTHVVTIEGGSPTLVTTADGVEVTANAVVVATNAPIN